MQSVESRNPFARLTLGALMLLASLISVIAAIPWLFAFIKLEQMRLPYMLLFAILLSISFALAAPRLAPSKLKLALSGGILGQLVATVSLTVANFFIPNGVERNLKSFARWGIFNALGMDFAVAFLLGGWLVAAILFPAIWKLWRHLIPQNGR